MELGTQIKKRQEYNKLILKQLEKLIIMFPEQRFGQIIENYVKMHDGGDFFYCESYATWKHVEDQLNWKKEQKN